MISGYRRGVNVVCALAGLHSAYNGIFLSTFRDNPSAPSSLLIILFMFISHSCRRNATTMLSVVHTYTSGGVCVHFTTSSEIVAFLLYHVSAACYSLLTPWCRVLEKLTGLQLVKKFPAFCGTRRFITALTSVRHLSLSWASPVHIPTSHLLEIHPTIIHPSTPRSPHWFLSLRFPHQDPIRPSLLTHTRHMPSPSHSSRFYHPHNIG